MSQRARLPCDTEILALSNSLSFTNGYIKDPHFGLDLLRVGGDLTLFPGAAAPIQILPKNL